MGKIRPGGDIGLRLNWKVTTFSLVFLVVFVRLGFWQLSREEEKIALLEAQAARANQQPMTLAAAAAADTGNLHLAPVSARGQYDSSSIFLLDNRVLNGEVGFEVLIPFEEAGSGQRVLVNRGFVPMGRTRQAIPDIPPVPAAETTLQGRIYIGDYRDIPRGEVAAPLGSMTVVQQANPRVLAELRGSEWFSHLVRLSIEDPHALPRHWPVTVMQPETHRGYAVQWFLMAIAVLIAWAAFTVSDNRRQHRNSEQSDHHG